MRLEQQRWSTDAASWGAGPAPGEPGSRPGNPARARARRAAAMGSTASGEAEGEGEAVEGVRAGAVPLQREAADDLYEHVPQPLDVSGEDPEYLGLCDSLA